MSIILQPYDSLTPVQDPLAGNPLTQSGTYLPSYRGLVGRVTPAIVSNLAIGATNGNSWHQFSMCPPCKPTSLRVFSPLSLSSIKTSTQTSLPSQCRHWGESVSRISIGFCVSRMSLPRILILALFLRSLPYTTLCRVLKRQ